MQVCNTMHRYWELSKRGSNYLMISKMSGLTVLEKEGTHIKDQGCSLRLSGNSKGSLEYSSYSLINIKMFISVL